MIEIAFLKEKEKIKLLPAEVKETIEGILEVINSEYGEKRDKYGDNGGYIVAIEKKEDFKELRNKIYIDCETVVPEYVDRVICNNGEVYVNALIICNSDYTISLIIPLELTPQNLRKYMID